MRQFTLSIFALTCVTTLLIGGCAANPNHDTTARVSIFWPAPPAPARIEYVRSFSRPADLGIGRGFWQWLSDVFTGRQEFRLIRPMAIVVSADNVIYVADPGAGGVHRFDQKAGEYHLISRADERILPSVVGLAQGPGESVYVVDSELAQLFQIRAGAEIATPLFPQLKLAQPTGIAYDASTQRLYIADTAKHHIVVLSATGEVIKTFGQRGHGDGEFNFPTYLWLDAKHRLFVTDSLNFRIQIFDQDGNYLGKFGQHGDGSGNLSRPKGVAVDGSGHVYVVDALFHAIQLFDEQGNLLLSVGQRGASLGEFYLPTGIFIANNSEIYIADSHNQRVQILRYMGEHP
jgi:DNA-binding beta-propeller fold protein YncE